MPKQITLSDIPTHVDCAFDIAADCARECYADFRYAMEHVRDLGRALRHFDTYGPKAEESTVRTLRVLRAERRADAARSAESMRDWIDQLRPA